MKRILGIDLGTNSLGWAVLEKEDGKFRLSQNENKVHSGVIVFPEVTTGAQQTMSKAAERRKFRGARRMKFRRKIRKYETLKVLVEYKMCPLSKEGLKRWKGPKNYFKEYPNEKDFLYWLSTGKGKTGFEQKEKNPYFLRDYVSRHKIDMNNTKERYMLGRALYHIAQRRGFKSNRLDTTNINLVQELKDELVDILATEKFVNTDQILDLISDIIKDRTGYVLTDRKGDMEDDTGKRFWSIFNEIKKALKPKKGNHPGVEEGKKKAIEILSRKEKLGKVDGSINELNQKIKEGGFKTLGQYFWHLYQQDRHQNENKIRGRYTSREEHYLQEFDVIMQLQFPDEVDKKYGLATPKKRYTGIARKLYDAIFYQRPLKPQADKVGKGVFEPDKKRIPVSHYLFEEFRMWQFINSIKIRIPGEDERFLTREEKEKIIPLFYRQKEKFPFDDIARKLIAGQYSDYKHFRDVYTDKFVVFNYRKEHYVSGNPVSAKLKRFLGDKWNKIYKNPEKGQPVTYNEIAWHALYRFDDPERLKEFARNKLGMDEITAAKFVKIRLPQGYGSLSVKATRNILRFLKAGLIYSHAVFVAKLKDILGEEKWEKYKDEIIEGIGKIIEKHRDDIKVETVVNSFIEKNRNKKPQERTKFSEQAKPIIRKEIERLFMNEYGTEKWESKHNKEELLEEALDILKKQLRKNPLKGGEFYSINTLEEKIKEFLKGENEDGVVYCEHPENLEALYHPSKISRFQAVKGKNKNGDKIDLLPEVQTFAVNNPVLKRAMSQLRKLINHLLKEGIIDKHTEIHLELARQVLSMSYKKAIEEYQKRQADKKEEYRKKLEEFKNDKEKCPNCQDIQITDYLILKYRLWEEQNRRCIYSTEDENQISLYDLIKPDSPYDIEHTIPRSRSWDNSLENKTIARADINRKIKRNKIPSEMENWEQILARVQHWKDEYKKLDKEIAAIKVYDGMDEKTRQRRIQERLVKMMERDYLKGKYERFTMKTVPESFKNRQLTDTGHITKMAREFLGSVFKNKNNYPNILTVNGNAVATFRELWGLDKNRDYHTHHMVDAIVAAAISRKLFGQFEEIWKKEDEKGVRYKSISETAKFKPWPSFTEDVLKLADSTPVVQRHIDQTGKQTKKKIRVTVKTPPATGIYKKIYKSDGSIRYRGIVYQQGDTARGALHQQNFYRKVSLFNPKTGSVETFYSIRKEIDKLKKKDLERIYDEKLRQVIEQNIKDGTISFNASGNIKIQGTVWQNKEKAIPLKKVRIKVDDKPMEIKPYPDVFRPADSAKSHFLAMNDENYGMILYENRKGKRHYKLINLYDYYNTEPGDIFEENIIHKNKTFSLVRKKNKPVLLRKGMGVILMNKDEEPIFDSQWVFERLYYIKGIDDDGIKMMHHAYGGSTSDAIAYMNEVVDKIHFNEIVEILNQQGFNIDKQQELKDFENDKKTWFKEKSEILKNAGVIKKEIKISKLTTPKGGEDVVGRFKEFPFIKKRVSDFHALLEGYDFEIRQDGRIEMKY